MAAAAATGIGIGTGMAPLLSPAAAANRLIIPSALTSPSSPPAPTRRSGPRPCRRRLLSAPAVARSGSDGAPALYSSSKNGKGASASALTFQQAIQRLQEYWASVGCAVMQCSNTEIVFSRPVRWILALHGDRVVPFSFAGISSGSQSCGLRNSSLANFKVETAESYLHTVGKAGIVIDMEERKAKIMDDSSILAQGVDGGFIAPDSLLQEVVNLVEAPVPILGRYDDSFLELPKDVLITVCSHFDGDAYKSHFWF